MELEILKLIYDYSVNRKLIDPKFIDKLIEIVVSKKSLNDYVRNVEFTNKLEKKRLYGRMRSLCPYKYENIS